MSLTDEVVAELAPHPPLLPCCRAAFVTGMILVTGGDHGLVRTPRAAAARALLHVLHLQGIPAHVTRERAARRPQYVVSVERDVGGWRPGADLSRCCARACLRGAFLAAGSVSRPDGPPQLEVRAPDPASAARLRACCERLEIGTRILWRRGRPVVAARDVAAVAAFLSEIGAQRGRLLFEEGRVLREVRAQVNRRLNAETANLRRTAAAGVRQAREFASLADEEATWARLPPALREAALLRLRHPDDSLEALAARAACSRSAMAGRLRRLEALARRDRSGQW